jgi:hypothetical protein
LDLAALIYTWRGRVLRSDNVASTTLFNLGVPVLVGKGRVGYIISKEDEKLSLKAVFKGDGLPEGTRMSEVYFRTQSGNVYRLSQDGTLTNARDGSAVAIAQNSHDMGDEAITVGCSFYYDYRNASRGGYGNTSPVTEIVSVVSPDRAGLRPNKSTDIVKDFEGKNVKPVLRKEEDKVFLVPEERRKRFIEENIVALFPEAERAAIRERVETVVNNYRGQDLNAMSVIKYALDKGRMEEFLGKLQKNFEDYLQYVHPEARRNFSVRGSVTTENFFLQCYKELGVTPQPSGS